RDLSAWIEADVPWDRIVTPANQPPNMWPAVKRFNNWFELEKLEKEKGPTWIVYGDYIAVTRGIWDFPYDMYPIALACREVEGEDFRAGTHVSAPIFLYENEDYYWGFVRRKRVAFDPDVRVIPTARILDLKDKVDWPPESVIAPWIHGDGEQGANVYRPFLDFGVYSHRSPWLGVGLVLIFFGGMVWICLPPGTRAVMKRGSARRRTAAALAALALIALVFRNYGISLYSQMGGDDVEYRTYIERMRLNPDFAWTGAAKPVIVASWLSGLDVNKTITVFAKPYFILERTVLAFLTGGDFRYIHYLTCLQGVATVLVVFMIGRRLRGNLCGLIAAAFWAVSPWAVTYSTWGIHVAGGGLAFAVTLWAYFAFVDRGRWPRALLLGLAAGTALMYSTSNIWPIFFLGVIESVHGPIRFRSRWPRLIPLWGATLAGLLLPWLFWEGMSSYSLGLVGYPHRWFPAVLLQATRDNLLHARALPVDILFFWRHLFLSEGWAAAALLTGSFLGSAAAVARRKARGATGVLVALTFSLTVVMNYTGIAQVIRHFFPAFLPLALLAGAVLSRWTAGKRLRLAALVAVVILISWRQWHRLDLFRETRWAPDRVGIWAQGHLFVPGRLATLPCQNLGLWPGLRPIGSWREMEQLGRLVPPGAMMYGDYIEISLGSWLYSFPEYYEISEVVRGLPSGNDLFRTPSYLAYLPNRFENEFYYWGLYRKTPPVFDPAIRVLPASDILARYRAIRGDPLRYRQLWEPTSARSVLKIPARPNDIYRPFMEPLERSSAPVPLALSALVFLALIWRGRPRLVRPDAKD
ncbi:MAG TPA: hypothetical protein PLI51_10720, partial [bacterium]|nr:hypothetical protein [bacterium]